MGDGTQDVDRGLDVADLEPLHATPITSSCPSMLRGGLSAIACRPARARGERGDVRHGAIDVDTRSRAAEGSAPPPGRSASAQLGSAAISSAFSAGCRP
jgi:hypothetical protein